MIFLYSVSGEDRIVTTSLNNKKNLSNVILSNTVVTFLNGATRGLMQLYKYNRLLYPIPLSEIKRKTIYLHIISRYDMFVMMSNAIFEENTIRFHLTLYVFKS